VTESFAEGLLGVVLDGRYRLDALLGEGGMGAVFRAHHLAMDRRVAIKLLKPHLTQDHTALERFAREARSTMKVESEHAVKVLDFGVTPHDDYYMVLEYLDGRTVQRELDVDGAFTPERVLHIAKQALHALGAAHRTGLIHRDIKPDNLLLMKVGDDADYTKVLDFGVAKLMEGAAKSSRSALSLTQAGMAFGTPEFMSPEQACGQPLDPRSDIYSVAATMFAMLTGCGMYQAGSAIEWLTAHARQPAPHLTDGKPELAAHTELDALLQRCFAKNPEHRPQDADALIREIEAVERGEAVEPREVIDVIEAPRPARPKLAATFSPSSFIPALAPVAPVAPAAHAPSPITSETDELHVPAGRGRWLVVGALAIAASIIVVIVLATNRSPSARAGKPVTDAAQIAVVPLVQPVDTGSVVVVDAVAAPRPVVPHVAKPKPEANPEIEQHIVAALAAQKKGNHLTQVTQAHAAVLLDPKNMRAVLLLADGLLAEGDLDHGCKYLRELARNPVAIQRMRSASCPVD